jgi:Spy/CpxP family protein refolding chaperone
MVRTSILFLSMTLGLLVAPVSAAPPAKGGPGAKGHPGPGQRIAQRMKRLRDEIIRYDVGLSDAKAAKVKQVLSKMDPQRRKLHERKRMATRAIRRLIRSDSNDQGAFKRAIADLIQSRSDLAALRKKQFTTLQKILTPKQQAKLFVALKRMQKRIKRAMRELGPRKGAGRGRGHHRMGPGKHRRPHGLPRGPGTGTRPGMGGSVGGNDGGAPRDRGLQDGDDDIL